MADESIRLIPIGKSGKFAIVDAEDFTAVSRIKWYLNPRGYVVRTPTVAMQRGQDYPSTGLHRLILKAPRGVDVDHISGDKLDNRRANIRLCLNRSDNQRNKSKQRKPSTSKYKGVSWLAKNKKWLAQIAMDKKHNKRLCLGLFTDEIAAAKAYDAAALEHFGQFARLNFPC